MNAPSPAATVGLVLEPLDLLFFRDGRPFGAGTRHESCLPLPQTLHGAVCTALLQKYGCQFDTLVKAAREVSPHEAIRSACTDAPWIAEVTVRGPWLARVAAKTQELEVLAPVPAILRRPKKARTGRLLRLSPIPAASLPGWRESVEAAHAGLNPLWQRAHGATEMATGFLTLRGLETFLHGEGVPDTELLDAASLLGYDRRTGIEVAADQRTARPGASYGLGWLVLRSGVSLYAEVVVPGAHAKDAFSGIETLAIGGEGRRVAVRPVSPVLWPTCPPQRNGKPLLMLTTPALFDAGWKPRCLEVQLVAAAVPGPLSVSGWDLARAGPKPARFAVAAGSVYFLATLPDPLPESISDHEEDRQKGWGAFVIGNWSEESP
ncbi:MAG: type III-B CRISPR module-associated protein Cmr3 [Planctomycetota bacterium]